MKDILIIDLIIKLNYNKASEVNTMEYRLNTFSEQILNLSENEKLKFSLKNDKAIAYLEKLLNEVNGDIREYLKDHPLI